jgi:hypothetical protein
MYYYTLVGETWSSQSKIVADVDTSYDYFGFSVTLYNADAFIGAYADDDKDGDSGISVNDIVNMGFKCPYFLIVL